jgi:hypothetical protein
MGAHESAEGHYGEGFGDDQRPEDKPMTRLQRMMQRSIGTWPLYTIIISLGQLLSAVSRSSRTPINEPYLTTLFDRPLSN